MSPSRRFLRYLMLVVTLAGIGTVHESPARAESSCAFLAAQGDPDHGIDGATSITVIVDGMMKSRSGAT